MKPIDISSLVKRYGPGYIARNKKTGRVIAHSKKIDVLFDVTKDKKNVVIGWVPGEKARYVFRISL